MSRAAEARGGEIAMLAENEPNVQESPRLRSPDAEIVHDIDDNSALSRFRRKPAEAPPEALSSEAPNQPQSVVQFPAPSVASSEAPPVLQPPPHVWMQQRHQLLAQLWHMRLQQQHQQLLEAR